MSKPIFYFNLVLLFISQIGLAQNKPELINSGDLLTQGTKLNDEGKYKEAIELYSKISRSDTNYSDALHELSYSCYLDSQVEASLNYAQTGLKLFPEKAADWYSLMGNAYDEGEKRDQAISCYDSALKSRPYNYLTWFNKGIAFYNLNRYDDAKACLQRAVLINPYHPSSHYFLGVICVAQGKIVPAMLSFTTCLLANPEGRYLNSATKYLGRLSKITDEITSNVSKAVQTQDDNFELQQEIIMSEVALDHNYKLQTDLDDPVTRQLQVLLEKLQYDAGDKGFWMQYYVPFYVDVFKKGEFNEFVNYVFSGLDIKSVKDYNKKNSKEIEAFTNEAVDYLNSIRRTEAVNYSDRTKENFKYYYGSENLLGIGKWIELGDDDTFYGPWEFFHDNGQLKSKGTFNDKGGKEGEWMYYYTNGTPKERSTFVNDLPEGKSTTWFDNGNLSEEDFYRQGKLNGETKTYFFNGLPKTVEHYKDDLKDGEMRSYTYDGFLNYVLNYIDDEPEGEAKFYYNNGKVEATKTFAAGKLNGPYRHYSEAGVLDIEGSHLDDEPAGQWKEYYDSKSIKAEYSYSNGELEGVHKSYYENGKVSETIEYSKGKMDGKQQEFDEDGIKYSDAVYEKGRLRELAYYDKAGNVISSSTTRKGAADLTFYDPAGNRSSQGHYDKDGSADGRSTYYYKSGKIHSELSYKSGLREGERTIYYKNGNPTEKMNFANDQENGLLTGFYSNGAVRYLGNYVDGEQQGEHQEYDVFGTLLSSAYFEDDELNGYSVYYNANGKKSYETLYRTGWLIRATQFDTTGKVLAENNFPGGNGELIYRYFNGTVYTKANYRNYLFQGKYEQFYFDGSPAYVAYYKNGQEDSIAKKYFYGGKPEYEGQYALGKKEGVWTYYSRSGKINHTQRYSNDKLDGPVLAYNDDGTKYSETNYHDNELEGPTIIYGDSNAIAVQLNYHKDELISFTYEGKDGKFVAPIAVKNGTGLVTAYYKNGKKSAELNFEESVINGDRKVYFTNGEVLFDASAAYGADQGISKRFFRNGKIAWQNNYFLGQLHGLQTTYYSNGNLRSEENWYNGEQNGVSKYYDENGRLTETRVYYYDILLSVTK